MNRIFVMSLSLIVGGSLGLSSASWAQTKAITQDVPADDQARIYLHTVGDLIFRLEKMFKNSSGTEYGCRNASILKLASDALEVQTIAKEANKIDRWTLRNISYPEAKEAILDLAKICEADDDGKLGGEERKNAIKRTKTLTYYMTLE